jgi:tetratricopeptide (TPR) repeat protein
MKNYKTAFSCQKKALKIQEKILPSDHPLLATRHFNMAVALEGLKRFEEAIDHITRAVEILRQTKGLHQRKIRHYQRYLDKLREKL